MWTLMVVVLITTTGCPVIIGTCLKLAQSFMDAKEGVIKADQKYLVVLWNVSIINTILPTASNGGFGSCVVNPATIFRVME